LEIEQFVNKMRRTTKKDLNLNKLNTGCSPCLNQALNMQKKISNRNLTKMKTQEVKKIVSSLFKKD
tara:strand:+ start:177 stop:374 length:198 start_codon:yes stop_codon:yes gene_type:complete